MLKYKHMVATMAASLLLAACQAAPVQETLPPKVAESGQVIFDAPVTSGRRVTQMIQISESLGFATKQFAPPAPPTGFPGSESSSTPGTAPTTGSVSYDALNVDVACSVGSATFTRSQGVLAGKAVMVKLTGADNASFSCTFNLKAGQQTVATSSVNGNLGQGPKSGTWTPVGNRQEPMPQASGDVTVNIPPNDPRPLVQQSASPGMDVSVGEPVTSGPVITVSPNGSAKIGQSVTLLASGLEPNQSFTMYYGQTGTTNMSWNHPAADAQGRWTATFTLSSGAYTPGSTMLYWVKTNAGVESPKASLTVLP